MGEERTAFMPQEQARDEQQGGEDNRVEKTKYQIQNNPNWMGLFCA